MGYHNSSIVWGGREKSIKYAEGFLKRRLYTLYYDVQRCMELYDIRRYPEHPSLGIGHYGFEAKVYFPALMYCFSVINLLGNLYAGIVTRDENTENSKEYMRTFMRVNLAQNLIKYDEKHLNLLYEGYRHQITHLSMPSTIFKYNKQLVTWKFDDPDPKNHLRLTGKSGTIDVPETKVKVEKICTLQFHDTFVVNIEVFCEDIIQSVLGSGRYLDKIKNENNDPNNIALDDFRKTIESIYRTYIIS